MTRDKDNFPVPIDEGDQLPMSRPFRRASRAQERAENAIYLHRLHRNMLVEFDRNDADATGDAVGYAFQREVDLLNHIRSQARGDAAILEMGAQKLELFTSSNNARARRRFGRLG